MEQDACYGFVRTWGEDTITPDDIHAVNWLKRRIVGTTNLANHPVIFCIQKVSTVDMIGDWSDVLANCCIVDAHYGESDPAFDANLPVINQLVISLGCQLILNEAVESIALNLLQKLVAKKDHVTVVLGITTFAPEYFTSGVILVPRSVLQPIRLVGNDNTKTNH